MSWACNPDWSWMEDMASFLATFSDYMNLSAGRSVIFFPVIQRILNMTSPEPPPHQQVVSSLAEPLCLYGFNRDHRPYTLSDLCDLETQWLWGHVVIKSNNCVKHSHCHCYTSCDCRLQWSEKQVWSNFFRLLWTAMYSNQWLYTVIAQLLLITHLNAANKSVKQTKTNMKKSI